MLTLRRRASKPPRLKVDLIGRTIGYGRFVPAVEYRHADGRLQYIVHGSKERAEANVLRFGHSRFVWFDEKAGLPAGGGEA
jgi:hypothetical protein